MLALLDKKRQFQKSITMVLDFLDENFSKLDAHIFDNKDEYVIYFKYLKKLYQHFLGLYPQIQFHQNLMPDEMSVVTEYVKQFLLSVEALRLKFSYNPDHDLMIDLTESGYPNFQEIKEMTMDAARASIQLSKIKSEMQLKNEILDYFAKYKKSPEDSHNNLLLQLSERKYYDLLREHDIFGPFNFGTLQKLDGGQAHKSVRYLLHWATYDPQFNRPFIYFMIFDYHYGGKEMDKNTFLQLQDQIKKTGYRATKLQVFATVLDTNIKEVRPKLIKRIDIGPIFGKYSEDRTPFTEAIKHDCFGEDDFIFYFTVEVLKSVSEKVKGDGVFLKKMVYQEYATSHDKDAILNKASEVSRFMIAPHRVVTFLQSSDKYKHLVDALSAPPICII